MTKLPATVLVVCLLALVAGHASAEVLQVHIIAHSHCDPGWLETFEGYYDRKVKAILTNVLRELENNAQRRFVWSETSFFHRWWREQPDGVKKRFRAVLKRGQLEFINSGWVQEDEGNPDVSATVNQLTMGHQYILQEFGIRPKIAWQIDPFGHSATFPAIAALAGFEALVINRIPFHVKNGFKRNKHMEFIWKGSDVGFNKNTELFTHVLHTHYSAPSGFDWEEGRSPTVTDGNVRHRAGAFASMMKGRAQAFRTNHLMVPFGDDFKFVNAARQFQNMDRLMKEINANQNKYGIHVFYSTPGAYFKAVQSVKGVNHPVHTGDFFPYADNGDSYWSGYLTTRPLMKRASRRLEALRRGAEVLHALQPTPKPVAKFAELQSARMTAGLFLHHDAITGTCKRHVMVDYMARMNSAIYDMQELVNELLSKAVSRPGKANFKLSSKFILSKKSPGEYFVALYNTLAWPRTELVSVRVDSHVVAVKDEENQDVPAQIDPVWDLKQADPSSDQFWCHFRAIVPPLGVAVYSVIVKPHGASAAKLATVTAHGSPGGPAPRGGGGGGVFQVKNVGLNTATGVTVESGLIKVSFSGKNGLLSTITDTNTGVSQVVNQQLRAFRTFRSGAYLFRPTADAVEIPSGAVQIRVVEGPIVATVMTRYANNHEVTTTVVKGDNEQLSSYLTQKINTAAGPNEEIVTRFHTSQGQLCTHDGLEWRKRSKATQGGIAANFFPGIGGSRLADVGPNTNLTVIYSHSMSSGSNADGQLDIMIHRSLSRDDGRGMGEAAMDAARVDIDLMITLDAVKFDGRPVDNSDDMAFKTRMARHNNPIIVAAGGQHGDFLGSENRPAGYKKYNKKLGRRLLSVSTMAWKELFEKYNPSLPPARRDNAVKKLHDIQAEKEDIKDFVDYKTMEHAGITQWRLRKDIADTMKAYLKAHPTGHSPLTAGSSTTTKAPPTTVAEPTTHHHHHEEDNANGPHRFIAPLGEDGFPPGVHLFSLFSLGDDTDEVVIRLQSFSSQTDMDGDITLMFGDDFPLRPSHLRELTLSANDEITLASYFRKRMKFTAGAADVDEYVAQSPNPSSENRQNTDEDGVFISDAALQAQKGGRRLLASADGVSTVDIARQTFSAFSTRPFGQGHKHTASRKLLATVGQATKFVFSGKQLRTFKFCLNKNGRRVRPKPLPTSPVIQQFDATPSGSGWGQPAMHSTYLGFMGLLTMFLLGFVVRRVLNARGRRKVAVK